MKLPSVQWSRLSRLLAVSLLLLTLQLGCASHPVVAVKPPTPLSKEILAQLGTIAVTSKPLSPPFASPRPPSGWAQGFSQGMKTGAYYGAYPGLVIFQFVNHAPGIITLAPAVATTGGAGLGLSTAGGVIGGLIGGPWGAHQASSEQSVEEAMATLGRVPGELRLTDLLRDLVARLIRDKASYNVMILQTSEISTPEDQTGYQTLIDKGIDSLLEIDLVEAGLAQGEGTAYDPELSISLSAKTRLIRVEDGIEIDTRVTVAHMYPSVGTRPFADWAAQNGQLFREELPRTAQHLAKKIVETLLLPPPTSN